MLEQVNLNLQTSKEEYKALKSRLQRRLTDLQRACSQSEISTIVVIEGWKAAGKGGVIRKLTERLDPRSFKLHAIRAPRTYELHLPWLWRFWTRIPNWGEMAIFDHSWYWRVLEERIHEGLTETQLYKSFNDINSFERTISADRYVFAKYFLHMDRKTQSKRLKKLESDPLTSWRVSDGDWEQSKHYNRQRRVFEEMLERSETEWAPWNIVESNDARWARIKILSSLVRRMESALATHGEEVPETDETTALDDDVD
jgi:polyphosphate kinase 2 (PPK2 family)